MFLLLVCLIATPNANPNRHRHTNEARSVTPTSSFSVTRITAPLAHAAAHVRQSGERVVHVKSASPILP